jgi:hypothetical protein
VLIGSPGVGWVEITGGTSRSNGMITAPRHHPTGHSIATPRSVQSLGVERTQLGQTSCKSLQLELMETRTTSASSLPLERHSAWSADDDHWTFRDLVRRFPQRAMPSCRSPPARQGTRCNLPGNRFTGRRSETVPPAWPERGGAAPARQIDLTADVYHLTGFVKPAIRVAVRPRPESASIEPRFFPYLMEKSRNAHLSTATADVHLCGPSSRTTIRTNGGNFAEDGPARAAEAVGRPADGAGAGGRYP